MADAYIYDSVRTPRGKGRNNGSLNEVTAARLSALILNALRQRNGLDGHAVEDVIWGNATQVMEQGGCLARTAVLASDLDQSIPGLSINRFCASGMEAVNLAANQIRGSAGEAMGLRLPSIHQLRWHTILCRRVFPLISLPQNTGFRAKMPTC